MRRQETDDGERENIERSRLGEIVRSLRPIYYAGVGLGTGYFYEDIFRHGGVGDTSRDLFNAVMYGCLDNCLRGENNQITLPEFFIIALGNSVGRIIRNIQK